MPQQVQGAQLFKSQSHLQTLLMSSWYEHSCESLPGLGGLGGGNGVDAQLLGQIFQVLDGLGFGLVIRHLPHKIC